MEQRYLGCWESGFRSAYDMLSGTTLVVSKAKIKGVYKLSLVKKAFEILHKQQPMLKASIVTSGYNSRFVLNVPFENIPIYESQNDVLEQFDIEMHSPIENEKFLWRACVLPNENGFYIIITNHHAIADALSIVSMVEQFTKIYSSLLEEETYNPINPSEFKLLPNVEQCLAQTNTWEKVVEKYEQLLQNEVDKIPHTNVTPIQQRKTQTQFYSIEADSLKGLLSKCKSNEVTLNSLLNALMLSSQKQINPDFRKASLKTPVSLKKFCEPTIDEDYIGCFLSIIETHHESDEDIWNLAQQYQQQLHSSIETLGFMPKHMDYAEADITLLAQLFGVAGARKRKYFPNTFGVSNIGKVNISDTGNVQIEDFFFNTNHSVGNYYMFLSAVTIHNKLNLIFSYTSPLIEDKAAQEFIDLYLAMLNKV